MSIEILRDVDFGRRDQPDPHLEARSLLEAWLAYQRHEFLRKLRDLDAEGIVAWSVPPLELSILGLVRHMTQMEHVWLSRGLGGGELDLVYGEDDYAGGSVESVEPDLARYFAAVDDADRAVAALPSLDAVGAGSGWPLRATLVKMIDEYALHAGQAHMLRFAALGDVIR
jgi:hypothetical protein